MVEVYGDGARGAGAAPLQALAARVETSGETVFFYLQRAQAAARRARRPTTSMRYLHRPANLEDLFLKLTGRQIRDDA